MEGVSLMAEKLIVRLRKFIKRGHFSIGRWQITLQETVCTSYFGGVLTVRVYFGHIFSGWQSGDWPADSGQRIFHYWRFGSLSVRRYEQDLSAP